MIKEELIILDSKDKILSILDELRAKTAEFLAFDTETTGLRTNSDFMVGFSFAYSDTVGYYVPLTVWENSKLVNFWTKEEVTKEVRNSYVPEFILDFLKFINSNFNLVMHNAPFDCNVVHSITNIDLAPSLACDTALLKHFVDSSSSSALKETAKNYSEQLGYSEEEAVAEQEELKAEVLRSGGSWLKKDKEMYKASLSVLGKYAAKDAILTLKVFRLFANILETEFSEKQQELFTTTEIMPLCRELVIPLSRHGVHVDPGYFLQLEKLATKTLDELEDSIRNKLEVELKYFEIEKGNKGVVSRKAILLKIMEKEGLDYPVLITKNEERPSLSKKAVENAYAQTKHWLWGHVLGLNELKYTKEELAQIHIDIMRNKLDRRYTFNLNSNDHLRWLLFDKLKVSRVDFINKRFLTKKTNKPIISEATLTLIYNKNRNSLKFIKSLIAYKKIFKLLNTYIEPINSLHENGILRMSMNQGGTVTGRFSCSGGINLQTLPRKEEPLTSCPECTSKDIVLTQENDLVYYYNCPKCKQPSFVIKYSSIKRGFIAPPGYKVVGADYNSLEPRCFTFYSNEKGLKEIYEKDLDFYSKIYCDIFDKNGEYSPDPKAPNFLKKLNSKARQITKIMALAVPYGAKAGQVANLLNLKRKTEKGLLVTDYKKGQSYIDAYLNSYPNLIKYMEGCEIDAMKKGYVETLLGRRRYFTMLQPLNELLHKHNLSLEEFLSNNSSDELKKKRITIKGITLNEMDLFKLVKEVYNWNSIDIAKRNNWLFIKSVANLELNVAKNFKIQGLAAHLTNRAMYEINKELKNKGLDAKIVLQVHDEIILYAKSEQVEEVKDIVKRYMENNEFTKYVDVPFIAEVSTGNNFYEAK